MSSIQILIVDDSLAYRSLIKSALSQFGNMSVISVASNGKLALDRMAEHPIDLVILDLEMPVMDGLQTLREIKESGHRTKVLLLSSGSSRGAQTTMEALALGASDFIEKPDKATGQDSIELMAGALKCKLRALFPEHSTEPLRGDESPAPALYSKVSLETFKPKVVVIGSSTGGPVALEELFSRLRISLNCPIVIVQHMPALFTAALAERISLVSGIPTLEAKDGMLVEPGRVYIAPGDFHLSLAGSKERLTAVLDQGPKVNWVRPAVDPLFLSAAEIFGPSTLGIVLTGMGCDGKAGAESIKERGGAVLIQDENSCIVFGMPGAVKACGAYDRIFTIPEMADYLVEILAVRKDL